MVLLLLLGLLVVDKRLIGRLYGCRLNILRPKWAAKFRPSIVSKTQDAGYVCAQKDTFAAAERASKYDLMLAPTCWGFRCFAAGNFCNAKERNL
jgi:hypothetical protein